MISYDGLYTLELEVQGEMPGMDQNGIRDGMIDVQRWYNRGPGRDGIYTKDGQTYPKRFLPELNKTE